MSRNSVAERFARTVDLTDPKVRKDDRALQSLMQGASIAKAAVTSGWSVSTLYRRGIVGRYCDWLSRRSKPQDPPSSERR